MDVDPRQNYTGAQEWIERNKVLQQELDVAVGELRELKATNRQVAQRAWGGVPPVPILAIPVCLLSSPLPCECRGSCGDGVGRWGFFCSALFFCG